MTVLVIVAAGLLGALVGSFSNVVIHRLPKGASIVHPGSACPGCGRRLRPHELVPVLSWAVQRGRCRGCGEPISARYPIVELLVAAGYVAVAARWFPLDHPAAFLALSAWWTILAIASLIDLDTYEIPDVLTLPGTLVLFLTSFAWRGAPLLPGPVEAAIGAAIGAGLLTTVNRVGALVLRRLRDTRERLWPIGFDQANLGALAGTLAGAGVGLAVAAASVAANLLTRRILRLPEGIVWGGWLLALLATPLTVGVARGVGGGLIACGAAALAGAAVWWIHDLVRAPRGVPAGRGTGPADETDPPPSLAEDPDEPVAMGFGDVKLAALLGVVLGWERLLTAVFVAVLLGAVVGVAARAAGGSRTVPFGPFLALGGVLALFFGDALIGWYLSAIGLG